MDTETNRYVKVFYLYLIHLILQRPDKEQKRTLSFEHNCSWLRKWSFCCPGVNHASETWYRHNVNNMCFFVIQLPTLVTQTTHTFTLLIPQQYPSGSSSVSVPLLFHYSNHNFVSTPEPCIQFNIGWKWFANHCTIYAVRKNGYCD